MDRRWAHIRTSYQKVKRLVTKSGTAMPKSQRELDALIAEAADRCKSSNQKMSKLQIGFKHFSYIFNALDGFTQCAGIDGGTGASSEDDDSRHDDSDAEPEQASKANIPVTLRARQTHPDYFTRTLKAMSKQLAREVLAKNESNEIQDRPLMNFLTGCHDGTHRF